MKKQITILILLFFNCPFICGQTWMKTDTPCDKELLKKTPGEWLKTNTGYHAKVSQQHLLEFEKRLNVIHQCVFNIYPTPMAFDVTPFYFTSDEHFASQLKIERDQYGVHNSYVNGTPTILYSYAALFCDYHCGRNAYEIMRGRGCEPTAKAAAEINFLDHFFIQTYLDDVQKDIMRVDGRPIKMMPVLMGKWKGYDLYSPENGSGRKMVLLHREGMLPYTPVTRKQYLERSIACQENLFENNIKAYDAPGLASSMDKKQKEENIKIQQKLRDDVLKYYRNELDATTKAGLLDAPAIIPGTLADMRPPIFTTTEAGGHMLVTENPAYIKKDLPKYIPQLIIYSTGYGRIGPDPAKDPYKLFEQDFPIEKLQAMIDK